MSNPNFNVNWVITSTCLSISLLYLHLQWKWISIASTYCCKSFQLRLIITDTTADCRSHLCSMKIFLKVWQCHISFIFSVLFSDLILSLSPARMNFEKTLSPVLNHTTFSDFIFHCCNTTKFLHSQTGLPKYPKQTDAHTHTCDHKIKSILTLQL